jgi:hypothetical protein
MGQKPMATQATPSKPAAYAPDFSKSARLCQLSMPVFSGCQKPMATQAIPLNFEVCSHYAPEEVDVFKKPKTLSMLLVFAPASFIPFWMDSKREAQPESNDDATAPRLRNPKTSESQRDRSTKNMPAGKYSKSSGP